MISLIQFFRTSIFVMMILYIIPVHIGVIEALSTRSLSSSSGSSSTIGSSSRSSSSLRYYILKRTIKLRKQLLSVYYRNDKALMTDEIVTIPKSIQPSTITRTTTLSTNSASSSSSSSLTTIIPSHIDSTTIAHVVLSQAGIIILSSIAFALIYGMVITTTPTTDFGGDISYRNGMQLSFPPQSTHWFMALFFGCGGAFPLIYTSHAANYPTAFGLPTSSSINNHVPYTITNILSMGYRNQMEVTHMILQLLGRRRRRRQVQELDSNMEQHLEKEKNTSTSNIVPAASSTTFSSIIILSMISSMTAISSELLYRLYLPNLLYSLTSDYIVAILVPAISYGVSHTQWNNNFSTSTKMVNSNAVVTMDTCMLLVHQTFAAIWYSMLYMCSGSILPCIMSHYMYDMDLLTSTWHSANNQLDYTDKDINYLNAEQQKSEMILTTTAQQQIPHRNDHLSESLLTSEAEVISRRFFLAFDSEHAGSWNEHDYERAMQYLQYNHSNTNRRRYRNDVHTFGLFHQYAMMTPSSHRSTHAHAPLSPSLLNEQRLQYKEYIQLLQHIYQCTNTIKSR